MNIRTIVTLAVAIFLGLVAVVLVRGYLNSAHKGAPVVAAGTGTPVVIAAQVIPRGATLQPSLLKVVSYPTESVPAGAFHTLAEVGGTGANARLALRSISPNEPVLAASVSGPGGKLTLASVLSPGMRAVSVRSNDVLGVGGFVLPGDHVDVLLTRAIGTSSAQAYTVTQALAENVRVMGVDQVDDESTEKPVVAKAVTVEVTPDQAQAITLGETAGAVSLSLRQVADNAPLIRRATTAADLGFAPKPAPPPTTASNSGQSTFHLRRGESEIHVTRGVDTARYAVSHF